MSKTYDPNVLPSFNFYGSWMGYFRQLNSTDAATLLEWCCWYCFEQAEPSEKNLNSAGWRLEAAWQSIKPQLDKQFEKWIDLCDKQKDQ